jgi:hypothetical protein
MTANSPSSQVPCLKSTVLTHLAFPSPPAPTPTYRAFIPLHKDDINEPYSSVRHTDNLIVLLPREAWQDEVSWSYKSLSVLQPDLYFFSCPETSGCPSGKWDRGLANPPFSLQPGRPNENFQGNVKQG